MSQETMMGIHKSNMSKHIDSLVEKGWIDKRRNPKYKWDKTFQYRVNILKIQKDLSELGFALDGYAFTSAPEVAKHNTDVVKQNTEDVKRKSEVVKRNSEIVKHTFEVVKQNNEDNKTQQQYQRLQPKITLQTTSEIYSEEPITITTN